MRIIYITVVGFFKAIANTIREIREWERYMKKMRKLFPSATQEDYERWKQIAKTAINLSKANTLSIDEAKKLLNIK